MSFVRRLKPDIKKTKRSPLNRNVSRYTLQCHHKLTWSTKKRWINKQNKQPTNKRNGGFNMRKQYKNEFSMVFGALDQSRIEIKRKKPTEKPSQDERWSLCMDWIEIECVHCRWWWRMYSHKKIIDTIYRVDYTHRIHRLQKPPFGWLRWLIIKG